MRNYYPGLRPNDQKIWDELLIAQPGLFDEVWYNVKLGDPVRRENDRNTMIATGAYDVTCWTIDVFARKDSDYYVIEVKPDAKANAIGQSLCYRELLRVYYGFEGNIIPVVLTDDPSPITEQAAALLGVTVLTP